MSASLVGSEMCIRDRLLTGLDIAQVSGTIYTTAQRTISDRLRVTKPELAGSGSSFGASSCASTRLPSS
eukprot:8008441-Alexandrium_andersonii.AAC.1